jgi:opacity protein-like surface antigen
MMIRKTISLLSLVLGIGIPAAPFLSGVCRAAQPMERHNWSVGVAFGVGPADVDYHSDQVSSDWQRGASPQARLGLMIGRHLMLGIEDQQWLDEAGVQDYKVRENFQNVNFVVTLFPGRTTNLTSGFLLRVGAGLAHARASALEPYPGGANEWGETYEVVAKQDESGWGYLVGGGYELRLSPHMAAGAVFTFNNLEFNEKIFDRVRFVPGSLNLTWYF